MRSPAATFDMPGCVTAFKMVEDFGAGAGATDVMATSSGQGDERPQSTHMASGDDERPTFEMRFSPSSSITNIDTLNDHANAELAIVANGSISLELTAAVVAAPQLGVNWNIGDDVGYDIKAPAFAPDGVQGVARAGGYELGLTDGVQTVTPALIAEETF